jgi:hypothetical protein
MAIAVPIAIGTVLSWAMGALAFRVIAALGVGIVTYVGIGAMLDAAKAEIVSLTAGLGTYVAQAVVLMRIDDGVTVVFSAIAARVAMKAFGPGGAIGSLIIRPPVG